MTDPMDNMEAQLETKLAQIEGDDDCIQCLRQISSSRQIAVPGAVFCDECAQVGK